MTSSPTFSSAQFMLDETLFAKKSPAVLSRGLASFPQDSEADRLFIQFVRERRQEVGADTILQLPNVPLGVRLHPILSDDLVYYLALGDYERSDLDLIERAIRPGDRVMDLGGGVGVCAARMAQLAGTPVVVVDARADLESIIDDTLHLNGLQGLFVHGAVCDNVPDGTDIAFTVCSNLWFSSLDSHVEGQPIIAPSRTLGSLYDAHRPDCVLMDIEGAEVSLDFNTQHRPRELVIEIHTPSIGTAVTCQVMQRILDAGYRLEDVAAQTWWFTRHD